MAAQGAVKNSASLKNNGSAAEGVKEGASRDKGAKRVDTDDGYMSEECEPILHKENY